MMNKILIIPGLLFLAIQTAFTQSDTTFLHRYITFPEYMEMVKNKNIEYAAEKYNVNITEAAIEIAKIFPDPYISFDWTGNRESGNRTGYEYASELGTTIELGGKRKARINLARSENELSKAQLADFFRNLRADATLKYLEALKQQQVFRVGYNSYYTMKQLANADSIRFKLGTIMQIDAIQSKLEAGILYNELIHSVTEYKNSLVQVTLFTGGSSNDTLFVPGNHIRDTCRLFSLNDLITTALENRADLVAALRNREASQNALVLARKERMTDIDLRAGFSNSYLADGGSPAASGIAAGIEIPLKFSGFSKGQIRMAKASLDKSEELFRFVEMQIRSEIRQAWNLYYVHCRQVENFEHELLENASDVLRGKIYSYQRGETSLLEVLNAQRTFNEIQLSYYDSLYDREAALVELERSAGIWDIEF